MSPDNIYYIGQNLAVIAVVGSLIAILYQQLQANKIAKAELALDAWMQTGAMSYALADTPEKAEFMHKVLFQMAPLSPAEELRLRYVMSIIFGLRAAVYNLRTRGLVEDAAYNGVAATTRLYLRSPAVRREWVKSYCDGADPGFAAAVETMMRETKANASTTPQS
jgi:hypothetical protein